MLFFPPFFLKWDLGGLFPRGGKPPSSSRLRVMLTPSAITISRLLSPNPSWFPTKHANPEWFDQTITKHPTFPPVENSGWRISETDSFLAFYFWDVKRIDLPPFSPLACGRFPNFFFPFSPPKGGLWLWIPLLRRASPTFKTIFSSPRISGAQWPF